MVALWQCPKLSSIGLSNKVARNNPALLGIWRACSYFRVCPVSNQSTYSRRIGIDTGVMLIAALAEWDTPGRKWTRNGITRVLLGSYGQGKMEIVGTARIL